MLPHLPQSVVNYLAAVKAKDAEGLARSFTDNALVHDEGRYYKGLDAITAWVNETQTKYKYEIEPLHASANGNSVKLLARLTGNFPGSPVYLNFSFRLASDKIASLEIGG